MNLRGSFTESHDLSYIDNAHDANIVGDIRTDLKLNYQWRMWIVALFEKRKWDYLETFQDSDPEDYEGKYQDMIDDIYD